MVVYCLWILLENIFKILYIKMKNLQQFIFEAIQEKTWLDLKEMFKDYFDKREAIESKYSSEIDKCSKRRNEILDKYNYEGYSKDKEYKAAERKLNSLWKKKGDEELKLDNEIAPQILKPKIKKEILDSIGVLYTCKKGQFYFDGDPVSVHNVITAYEGAKKRYFEDQRIAKETKEAKKEYKEISKFIPKSWQFVYDSGTKTGVYTFNGTSSWGHPQHTNLEKVIDKLKSAGWKSVDSKSSMNPDDSNYSSMKIYMSPDNKFQLVQTYIDGNYGDNKHIATISKIQ